MCGIVGYIGFRDSKEVLFHGLQKMEYRGYDSAGLVVVDQGNFQRIRSAGDLKQLKKKLDQKNYSGQSGIGHTRWATHGEASEKNAHPHQSKGFYLVHNGVIENASELKAWLKGPFHSDTDSEVILHCLINSYENSHSMKEAVFDTMAKLNGEYAVVLMSEKHPDKLWAFKKGPSLVIGLGEKEIFLASDPQAFLSYTKKVIFLKDNEIAHIDKFQDIQIYSEQKTPVKKQIQFLDSELKESGQSDYPYLMLKEIYEQPECVSRIIETHIDKKRQSVELSITGQQSVLDRIIQFGRLNISACGSSYYASIYAKYMIERLSGIFVAVDMASEFRYRSPILEKNSPILLVSQSGETADTLAVLKMVQKYSCSTLSLCNVVHSTIDRESLAKLYMSSGVEKAVASTKSFSSTLVMLFLLALSLAKKAGRLNSTLEKKYVQSLLLLPSQMEELLSQDSDFVVAAHFLRTFKSYIYLGRDVYYPLALEGALKMKELTYRHAEAYPAGEMKHGPLALIDDKMAIVGLVPQSHVYEKTLTNLQEAKTRGGHLIVIGTKGDRKAQTLTPHFLPLPASHESLRPILSVLVLQLMAYHLACALGHNVDRPRNLAKSVTVE